MVSLESPQTSQDEFFMARAIELASQAAECGEVPVGAVVVVDGHIVGEAGNSPITQHDPTAHAEVLAIRQACAALQNYRIPAATLYVTIEPCAMCLGSLVHARVGRLVFGALEPKAGVLISNQGLLDDGCFNHAFELVSGVKEAQCAELMSSFFQQRRAAIKARKTVLPENQQHR